MFSFLVLSLRGPFGTDFDTDFGCFRLLLDRFFNFLVFSLRGPFGTDFDTDFGLFSAAFGVSWAGLECS